MSDSALQSTLENFQNYILDKGNDIEASILGNTTQFRQVRLGVYHAAYLLRLIEILGKSFPILKTLVGEDVFEIFATDYVGTYPSNHFSVRLFGRHFPHFLSRYPRSNSIQAELAHFEWALGEAIDSEDGPQLTFEEMSNLAPEAWANLKFFLHPSVTKHSFTYPIPQLWKSLHDQTEHPDMICQEKPSAWLIWRRNLQSNFTPATDEQIWMLDAMTRAENFSEICAGLCEFMEEDKVVSFAAETLRQWITEGIFTRFEID